MRLHQHPVFPVGHEGRVEVSRQVFAPAFGHAIEVVIAVGLFVVHQQIRVYHCAVYLCGLFVVVEDVVEVDGHVFLVILRIVAYLHDGGFYGFRVFGLISRLSQEVIIGLGIYEAVVESGYGVIARAYFSRVGVYAQSLGESLPVQLYVGHGALIGTGGFQLRNLRVGRGDVDADIVDIDVTASGCGAVVVYLKCIAVKICIGFVDEREVHLHPVVFSLIVTFISADYFTSCCIIS